MASIGVTSKKIPVPDEHSHNKNSLFEIPEYNILTLKPLQRLIYVHALPLGSLGKHLGTYLGKVRSNKRCYMVVLMVNLGF